MRVPSAKRATVCAWVLLGASAPALAQAPQAPEPPEAPATPEPQRFTTTVDDPLLAPAPRPAREIDTWSEARGLLEERSTDLRAAMAGIQQAEGRWRQALSALLPNATAIAGTAHDFLNPTVPPLGSVGAGSALFALNGSDAKPTEPVFAGGVTLSQSLVDLSAWSGLRSASAAEKSAEASFEDTRRRVTHALARTLVAVVAAERAAELNRVGLEQAHERAALTERMLSLGAATQLDVVRVHQDLSIARNALISGDEQLRQTREALGLALGLEMEAGVAPGFSLEGIFEELNQQCRKLDSVEERPDLVAARARVDAAKASREQALAGYLPRLGLTSSASAITATPGFARVPTWSVAAVISFPLWEGGLREGLVQERQGVETQTEQQAEALLRNATIEQTRAQRAESVARSLAETAREARDLAARVDQLTRRSFEIGRASSLDLVQSAVALRQAELTLALREFEWVQARLDSFLTVATCAQ